MSNAHRDSNGAVILERDGGGLVAPSGWIHLTLVDLGIEPETQAVLATYSQRLSYETRSFHGKRSTMH